MKVIKLVCAIFISSISAIGLGEERLAICTVYSGEALQEVIIQKYSPELSPPQQHLSTIAEVGGEIYQMAQTFDGSEKVGIGHGSMTDVGIGFDWWVYGTLPLFYASGQVIINCDQ